MAEAMNIQNKNAFHNYEILEKFESGIALEGSEVKSLRQGRASLKESYGKVENGEVILYNFHIASYDASFEKHKPLRKKKLLLHKREIRRLLKKTQEKGLTIVPIKVYSNNRGFVKVEIALAKGKLLYDKRRVLKEKEQKREIERKLKNRGAK